MCVFYNDNTDSLEISRHLACLMAPLSFDTAHRLPEFDKHKIYFIRIIPTFMGDLIQLDKAPPFVQTHNNARAHYFIK